MQASLRLLGRRRFLPLFATQFLGAFNDHLFRNALIILVIFRIYADPEKEAMFAAVASALFILPFFLFSALAGQLADSVDKAGVIRIVKTAEIGIMVFGAAGLLLGNVPLLLAALFAMGVHSTFFGPIKYAILPQHLRPDEVLGGTGLVEAGTYGAILLGTIVGGIVPAGWAAAGVLATAVAGWFAGRRVPPAPPEADAPAKAPFDWHVVRASVRLVSATMHIPRLFLAIMAISFFWAMGAVLGAQFPPLVKNVLGGDQEVATLFLSIFSVGVAIGSVAINRLLGGEVSARWAPASALVMGAFVTDLYLNTRGWVVPAGGPSGLAAWIALPGAIRVTVDLLGVAVAGGMFVVPLYAFLTTTVPKAETARTVAANNIVNSGAMVASTLMVAGAVWLGVTIPQTLLFISGGSVVAAYIAWRLHRACD